MNKVTLRLLLLFMPLFTGCAQYVQIYTVNSNDVKKENNEMVFENDTVKITYYFWEERGVLAFSIFNKLTKPLYIDWKKSAVIFKDLKCDYWFDAEERNTRTNYAGYTINNNLIVWNGMTYEKKIKEERITFIPPKSEYRRWQYHIYGEGLHEVLFTGLEEKTFLANYGVGKPVQVKGYQYEKVEVDSLVKPEQSFRNFLTFSLKEDISNEFYVDNTFFVKSIMELEEFDFTSLTYSNFQKNDKFYIHIPEERSVKYRKSYAGQ